MPVSSFSFRGCHTATTRWANRLRVAQWIWPCIVLWNGASKDSVTFRRGLLHEERETNVRGFLTGPMFLTWNGILGAYGDQPSFNRSNARTKHKH
jgi:hypothetical protein